MATGNPPVVQEDFRWFEGPTEVFNADTNIEILFEEIEGGSYFDLQYKWRSNLTRTFGPRSITCDNVHDTDVSFTCAVGFPGVEATINLDTQCKFHTQYLLHC